MSTCGQVDWNIAIINVLKPLVRVQNDIELWPSRYSFPHAITTYVASYNEPEQLQTSKLKRNC